MGIAACPSQAVRATCCGLSHAHRLLGDAARAREFIEDALTIARDRRAPAWEAFWRLEEGRVLVALDTPVQAPGRHEDATESHRYAVDMFRRFNERWHWPPRYTT
jgi:hypothetical protein